MTTSSKRDAVLTTINSVVWLFLLTAVVFSTSHIIETSHRLGLTYEAYAVPVFVDGIALVGKLSMLPRFSARLRRSGLRLLMFGGTLSLAANVYAGHNAGQKGFGILIVAGFMLLEGHAVKVVADRVRVKVPAEAPVSPGQPPAPLEAPEAIAFRQAQQQLRQSSRLARLNPTG